MKFKKDNASVYVLITALLGASGITTFARVFPDWDPTLYMLSLLILAICCAMQVYLFRKLKEKAHPLRDALIGGAVFYVLAFGAVFLVNNVILQTKNATLATFIMSAAFALAFLAGATAALFAGTDKAASRAMVPLACLVFLTPSVLFAAKPLLPVRYEHPFENKIAETEGLSMASKKNRLLINADDSHWWGFWNELAKAGKFDDESLNEYVMNYADSGVTDLLFNIFCQSSDTPSEVFTFRGDLYGQTQQHGNPVDYSNYYGLNAFYNGQKKDIFAVWIAKCREVGIRPWLTLRMNDCHDPDEETSQLRGELFYTAEENGWVIGEEYGYYRHCVDYAVPEIRQMMLDYTKEQLLRYDVDALELDFMREIYCFDYKNENEDEIVEIMNGYMRDTAAIVREAEAKWGHDIELSVRMMRDIDQCRAYGFDVAAWCGQGLVDSVTVTPRFSSNDSAMPLADWKARCPGVKIFAGVETLVNTNAWGCCASAEVVRGYGAQYLTAGADGLYLFNYMTSPPGIGEREKEVYDTCGSLTEILKHSRRHVVTYQDTVPDGWEPYDPLPLKLKKNEPGTLEIETGAIPDGAAVTVVLGFEKALSDEAALTVKANGVLCEAKGKTEANGRAEAGGGDVPGGYCRAENAVFYAFTVPADAKLTNLLTLELTAGGGAPKVVYAEADVNVA